MSSIVLSGDTSGQVSLTVPAIAGSNTVTIPAGTGTAAVQGVSTNIVSGTAVASTSGTAIDFTGIPAYAKQVTIMFSGVSTNGNSNYLIRLGIASGFATTGYTSAAWGNGTTIANSTVGMLLTNANNATYLTDGAIVLNLLDSNTNKWVSTGILSSQASGIADFSSGAITLPGVLTQVRITSITPDTFDAGSINISWQ